jgi:hypothetical protein
LICSSISFDEALKQTEKKFSFGEKNDGNHEDINIENDQDFEIKKDSTNLGQIPIIHEHSIPNVKVPWSTGECWELFRRRPDFYASNLSKQSSIFIQKKNRK